MNGPVIGGQHWAFGSGRVERINAEALPQLATDAPWPVGQPVSGWSGLGLPPRFMAVLEVHGRKSGHSRSNPVVIATVDGSS